MRNFSHRGTINSSFLQNTRLKLKAEIRRPTLPNTTKVGITSLFRGFLCPFKKVCLTLHRNLKFNKIKGYFHNKFKGPKGIGSLFAIFGTKDLRNLEEFAHYLMAILYV